MICSTSLEVCAIDEWVIGPGLIVGRENDPAHEILESRINTPNSLNKSLLAEPR